MKLTSQHLHDDSRVSVARVDAFGEASRAEQLTVLTELRRRSMDDTNDVQSSVMIAAFGVLATIFVAPMVTAHAVPVGASSWTASLAVGITAGIVIAIIVVPVIAFAVIHSARRERAIVWLRAYEDELQRRWLSNGKVARSWRRRHLPTR